MGPTRFVGNQFADKYAKLGARRQEHQPWHRAAYIQRFKLVSDVLEFAAYVGVLGQGLDDTFEGSEPPPEAPNRPTLPDPPRQVEEQEGHPTPPGPNPAPLPPGELLDRDGGRIERARAAGHQLVRLRSVVFCRLCARYAKDRWVGLCARCPGDDPRKHAGRLNRLWAGRHPSTNRPF